MAKRLTILLTEDDEIHREMTHRMLGDLFDLHDAETGEQALELLDRITFHCVLLDNRLPDYTGIELLPLIARHEVPVIMLTSLVTDELIAEAEYGGCKWLISKDGLTTNALVDAISNAAVTPATR
ncbi:MAG: response regulator [Gammaproteobacteria bacterium]|nr:response regulator [Gammaproteobacteria bacterium]